MIILKENLNRPTIKYKGFLSKLCANYLRNTTGFHFRML